MKVVVSGATGFLGRKVVESLLSHGHQVLALSRRRETAAAKLPAGVRVFAWQPESSPVPPEALDGADALIHLAGENIGAGRWTSKRKAAIRDSRVLGTRNLAVSLSRVKERPRILLCASAMGFYGDGGEAWLSEDRAAGSDFLARVTRDWEGEAMAMAPLGLRVCLLRLGHILGRGDGILGKMETPFSLGLGPVFGKGDQFLSWIHRDDAAGLFVTALTDERYRGPLNAVAPDPVRMRDFADALARALHRPRFLRLPAPLLRLGLGEMAEALLGGQRLSGRKAYDWGYFYRYPRLNEALRAIFRS